MIQIVAVVNFTLNSLDCNQGHQICDSNCSPVLELQADPGEKANQGQ